MNAKVQIAVGAFFFAGLIALLVLTIFVGGRVAGAKHQYFATFEDGAGLRAGDPVRLRGVRIGEVLELTFDDANRVRVRFQVEPRWVRLMHDKLAAGIGMSSLLGGSALMLSGDEIGDPLPDRGEILHTSAGEGIDRLISSFSGAGSRIEQQLSEGGDLALALRNVREITDHVNRGEGLFGRLLKSEEMADHAAETLANLKAASVGIKSVAEDIGSGKGIVGMLIKDEGKKKEVAEIITDVREISNEFKTVVRKVNEGDGTVAMLLNDKQVADDLRRTAANLREGSQGFNKLLTQIGSGEGVLPRLLSDSEMGKSFANTMRNVEEITDKVNAGDGTIARLINDGSAYSELKGMLSGIRETIDDAREAIPIASFASILVGALR